MYSRGSFPLCGSFIRIACPPIYVFRESTPVLCIVATPSPLCAPPLFSYSIWLCALYSRNSPPPLRSTHDAHPGLTKPKRLCTDTRSLPRLRSMTVTSSWIHNRHTGVRYRHRDRPQRSERSRGDPPHPTQQQVRSGGCRVIVVQ